MIPGDDALGQPAAAGLEETDFVLEGGGDLTDVPADDVATFIAELVRVVARSAGRALNRPVKDTGRFESLVKAASQVRLVSIRSGSVIVGLAPSKSAVFRLGDNLGLDAQDVSQRALDIVRTTVETGGDAYPDVARAWLDLAERVGIGKRYDRVAIESPGRQRVVLDEPARARLVLAAGRTLPDVGADMVRGVLFEADFERLTAKLRPAMGQQVDVSFDLEHADDIKHALRNLTSIAGHVEYDRRTNRVTSIALERIDRPVQLSLESEFWADKSARQLLEEQGVTRRADSAWFRIPDVPDEEWDAFFEALAG